MVVPGFAEQQLLKFGGFSIARLLAVKSLNSEAAIGSDCCSATLKRWCGLQSRNLPCSGRPRQSEPLGYVVGALVNYGRAIVKNDLDKMSDPFQEKVLQKLQVIWRSSPPHTKEFEHAALYV
jgi:hypothetical protein